MARKRKAHDTPTLSSLKRCHAKLIECRRDPRLPYLDPFGTVRHFKNRNEVDCELQRLEFDLSLFGKTKVTADG
ncbi:MAG: hypothetical protein OXH65_03725 [Paracoccaceae bacterium]|nr:hypothetical protein [Paracoccaceae bacterium]